MDAEASKKERLHKAFLELQSHSSALVNFTVQWKELEDEFNELEKLIRFEESTGNSNKTSPALKYDVKPCPQLKSLCEKMDGEGLKKFLANSSSDFTVSRNEASAALRCAADPAKLVLQALKGFYPAGNGRELSIDLVPQRYACNLLLESLPSVLSPDEVSSEAKKDAQKIAAAWKSKLNLDAESQIKTVEVHAFLQLLVSYGISKEFKDDDLFELVLRISRHPETPDLRISRHPELPELCRALQISHKIPDVVEKLSSSGKQIGAIQFIYAFGLEEKFLPVPLLEAYLEDEKRVSQELAQQGGDPVNAQGGDPVNAQNYAAWREIASLNTVIKCIEDHKLESQMSIKDLQKRARELSKAMSKRKRTAKSIKFLTKRGRLNSGAGVFARAGVASVAGAASIAGAASVAVAVGLLPKPSPPSAFALFNSSALLPKPTPPSAFALSNSSDLYRPAPVASFPSYNLPGQGVYDRGSQGIYRSAYDVGSNPSFLSISHLYPSDNVQ
uniref:FRIGIDA-like protein n=1 Tax=Picea sitchensis TaxID=3332 RepID=A9NVZ1_PICSI|nr:unknown [Picea sitchensis]